MELSQVRTSALPLLCIGVAGTAKIRRLRKLAGCPEKDLDGMNYEVREFPIHDDYKARVTVAPTHIEIDVSDFSMQEKQILPELLLRLTQHGDVFQGFHGKQRLLIIRRAHAMSLVTAQRIRATLEQACLGPHATTCVWLTAREMNPTISFLEDLFIKIRHPKLTSSPPPPMLDFMNKLLSEIIEAREDGRKPDIHLVFWVRDCVYALLGLNLTTLESIDLLFQSLVTAFKNTKISESVFKKCIETIGSIACSASYRTPLLLEAVFLDVAQIIITNA